MQGKKVFNKYWPGTQLYVPHFHINGTKVLKSWPRYSRPMQSTGLVKKVHSDFSIDIMENL